MSERPNDDQPVVQIDVEECWDLLEANEIGRLGYRLVDEVHIVPINYVVKERALLFSTAPGSKLFASELHSDVALEIDWWGEDDAWSVLARGRLRHLAADEQASLGEARFHSWIPTPKGDVVELLPESVTGRRFLLSRPEVDGEV